MGLSPHWFAQEFGCCCWVLQPVTVKLGLPAINAYAIPSHMYTLRLFIVPMVFKTLLVTLCCLLKTVTIASRQPVGMVYRQAWCSSLQHTDEPLSDTNGFNTLQC
jgi:hypothetical protein